MFLVDNKTKLGHYIGDVATTEEEISAVAGKIGLTDYAVVADQDYTPPADTLSVEEQLINLESEITDRNIRSAILGDEYALEYIRSIEEKASILRGKL